MALATRITTALASSACDAIVDAVDADSPPGLLRIYDGTQPATANTAVSSQTKLAEFTLSNPAFGAASSGTATAAGVPLSTTAVATGTASWFRVVTGAGTTLWDGSVGTSGTDMVIDNTSIASGQTVKVNSWTFTIPTS